MVTKTEQCSYTENKIYPGRGRRFIDKSGKTFYFITHKAGCMFHKKTKPVKLTWTLAWRRFNKKIRVDDVQKRRTKRTTRVQKAVVGMSLDELMRKRAETRDERDKKIEVASKEVKERKMKQKQQKQADKVK